MENESSKNIYIKHGPEIIDSFELIIIVPTSFPRELPKVTEIANRIPRDGNHHVNPDGTLCLGSPLRLLSLISGNPDIICLEVDPFFRQFGGKFKVGLCHS